MQFGEIGTVHLVDAHRARKGREKTWACATDEIDTITKFPDVIRGLAVVLSQTSFRLLGKFDTSLSDPIHAMA